jgi:hypothetical protein
VEGKWSWKLTEEKTVYISTIGCSYGVDPERKIHLPLEQALLGIDHRHQTILVDKIYSLLGLLPYGNLVPVEYKD